MLCWISADIFYVAQNNSFETIRLEVCALTDRTSSLHQTIGRDWSAAPKKSLASYHPIAIIKAWTNSQLNDL